MPLPLISPPEPEVNRDPDIWLPGDPGFPHNRLPTKPSPDSPLIETLINYVKNPSVEIDLTGVTNSGNAVAPTVFARQSGWSSDGRWALRYTTVSHLINTFRNIIPTPSAASAIPITPGEYTAAACDINIISRTANGPRVDLNIDYYIAGGTYLTTRTFGGITAVGEHSIYGSAPAPATAAFFGLTIQITGATGGGGDLDFYVDNMLLTKSIHPLRTWCGDHPDCYWVGTAHNSYSHKRVSDYNQHNPKVDWTIDHENGFDEYTLVT